MLFKLLHVPYVPAVLRFSHVVLAPHSSEVPHENLGILFDKDSGPEVLDQWVGEKVAAARIIVFSEYFDQGGSVDRFI